MVATGEADKAMEAVLGYGIGIETIRAFIFGHLIKLATPVIKSYHSDLFHDAVWLNENLTDLKSEFVFAWSVDECGTLIGTSEAALYRKHPYRVSVCQSGRLEKVTLMVDDMTGVPTKYARI